jgi:hypothetical protein
VYSRVLRNLKAYDASRRVTIVCPMKCDTAGRPFSVHTEAAFRQVTRTLVRVLDPARSSAYARLNNPVIGRHDYGFVGSSIIDERLNVSLIENVTLVHPTAHSVGTGARSLLLVLGLSFFDQWQATRVGG